MGSSGGKGIQLPIKSYYHTNPNKGAEQTRQDKFIQWVDTEQTSETFAHQSRICVSLGQSSCFDAGVRKLSYECGLIVVTQRGIDVRVCKVAVRNFALYRKQVRDGNRRGGR